MKTEFPLEQIKHFSLLVENILGKKNDDDSRMILNKIKKQTIIKNLVSCLLGMLEWPNLTKARKQEENFVALVIPLGRIQAKQKSMVVLVFQKPRTKFSHLI